MEPARWPRYGVAAGTVVGALAAIALVATGVLTVPVHRDPRDASTEFLQAWTRSRQGTYVVESEFRRRLGDGRTLFSASRLAQRPPDRIVRQFGGIDGTVNGHPIICSTDQSGHYSCFAGSQVAAPYDQVVAREVATFRSYFDDAVSGSTTSSGPAPATAPVATTSTTVVQSPAVPPGSVVRPGPATAPADPTGTAPSGTAPSGTAPVVVPETVPDEPIAPIGLYRVGFAPQAGCFELFQKIRYPDPPYGSYALFCFDADTGAMTRLERHLANDVVENLQSVRIVPQVTPTDLDTAADPAYEVRMDLGGFEEPVAPPTPAGTTPPGTDVPAGLATATNDALIADGSARVQAGQDAGAYVDEALRRLRDGRLSINAADWTDRGAIRALTRPVVLSLLAADIYLPPPPRA